TLYAGLFFIIVQNAVFFLLFFRRPQLKKWLLAQAIIILLYLPWIRLFIPVLPYWTGPQWIAEGVHHFQFFYSLFQVIIGTMGTPRLIKVSIIGLYLFLFISAFFAPGKKNNYFLLAWIVIPIISIYLVHFFLFPVLRPRYIGFVHIPLIILFSKGLDRYSAKIKYPILIFLLFFLFTCCFPRYYKFNLKLAIFPHREDWRGLFRQINAEKGDNTLIATLSNQFTENKYLYNMYFDFSKGIKYYNYSRQIPILTCEELEKSSRDKNYDSIFLVYYLTPGIECGIKGYRLEKRFKEGVIGYFHFKKNTGGQE
ncbi:MAG: hypothetical protein WC321_06335, partial [Candidatus Omnitrophota bacterium]